MTAPLRVLHGGVGLTITSDKLGYEQNIQVKLGYAYYMQGLLEPAINAYESAKRLNPDSIEIGQSLKMCINELQKDQTIQ